MSDKERMTDNEIIKALECCSANYIACKECPFNSKSFCERYVIENAFDFVKRQQAEIERLKRENKILSINADNAFQDGLNEAQDLYAEQVKNEVQAEAINEFADSFDDELAKLRDTYFERGLKDYSLVCEVIHDYLYRTLREMVGTDNG